MKIQVKNTSQQPITRGGVTFPPHSTLEKEVKKHYYWEIRACEALKVKRLRNNPTPVEEEQVDRPVVDKTDNVDEHQDEQESKKQEDGCPCPYCDFVAKNEAGLKIHIGSQHKQFSEISEDR